MNYDYSNMFRMNRGGLSLGTTCPGPGSGLDWGVTAKHCWSQWPGNPSPGNKALCTSGTIINQRDGGAASVPFSPSSPSTIHKSAFVQDWNTGMQPYLTAQAPKATWFGVELTPKGHRVLWTLKNQSWNKFQHLAHTEELQNIFVWKANTWQNPFPAHISLLTPLFLPLNFNFPIRNLMTEYSQGEELGCAIPNRQVSIYCFTE